MFEDVRNRVKAAWKSGFEMGKALGKRKRRGSLDPRVGLGLAAVFITAFIVLMVVAIIQPTVDQNIPTNSTLRPAYESFTSYVGKSFDMWGLAIFVSVLGLVVGAIYAFWRG